MENEKRLFTFPSGLVMLMSPEQSFLHSMLTKMLETNEYKTDFGWFLQTYDEALLDAIVQLSLDCFKRRLLMWLGEHAAALVRVPCSDYLVFERAAQDVDALVDEIVEAIPVKYKADAILYFFATRVVREVIPEFSEHVVMHTKLVTENPLLMQVGDMIAEYNPGNLREKIAELEGYIEDKPGLSKAAGLLFGEAAVMLGDLEIFRRACNTLRYGFDHNDSRVFDNLAWVVNFFNAHVLTEEGLFLPSCDGRLHEQAMYNYFRALVYACSTRELSPRFGLSGVKLMVVVRRTLLEQFYREEYGIRLTWSQATAYARPGETKKRDFLPAQKYWEPWELN